MGKIIEIYASEEKCNGKHRLGYCPGGTCLKPMKLARDSHYKNGYIVKSGGDYIVRPLDPLKTMPWDAHVLLDASTGNVLGEYLSKQAAAVRAQQFGGNTPKNRRYKEILGQYLEPKKVL
jgi:hypothetical protein